MQRGGLGGWTGIKQPPSLRTAQGVDRDQATTWFANGTGGGQGSSNHLVCERHRGWTGIKQPPGLRTAQGGVDRNQATTLFANGTGGVDSELAIARNAEPARVVDSALATTPNTKPARTSERDHRVGSFFESAPMTPFGGQDGNDQARRSQARLILARFAAGRNDLTNPAIGTDDGAFDTRRRPRLAHDLSRRNRPRQRRVNHPDAWQHVARTLMTARPCAPVALASHWPCLPPRPTG